MNKSLNNIIYITKQKTIDLNTVCINQTFSSKAEFYKTLGVDYTNGTQVKRIKNFITISKTSVPKEVKITNIIYPTQDESDVSLAYPVSVSKSQSPYELIKFKEYKSFRQLLFSIGMKYSQENIKKVKRHIDYEQVSKSVIRVTNVYDEKGLLDGMKYNSNTFNFFISLIQYLQANNNTSNLTVRQIQKITYPVQLLFESEEWVNYKKNHKEKIKELNRIQRIIEKNAYKFVYDQLIRCQSLNRIKVQKTYYTFIDGKEQQISDYIIPKIQDIRKLQYINYKDMQENEANTAFNKLLYKETGYDNIYIKWNIKLISSDFLNLKIKPQIINKQFYFDHAINLLQTNELKLLIKTVFKNFL